MYTSKYPFLCKQLPPILTVVVSQILHVITNEWNGIALCDILETLASVLVLGHRLVTLDTTFSMSFKYPEYSASLHRDVWQGSHAPVIFWSCMKSFLYHCAIGQQYWIYRHRQDMKSFLHHCGSLPVVTKSVNIITSPVLIFFTSMWHGNLRMWGWLYILALCGFGLGVELVLFPDTQYDTHTILRSAVWERDRVELVQR